jgi:hypothetical protein
MTLPQLMSHVEACFLLARREALVDTEPKRALQDLWELHDRLEELLLQADETPLVAREEEYVRTVYLSEP